MFATKRSLLVGTRCAVSGARTLRQTLSRRDASTLLLIEHKGQKLTSATLSALSAAQKLPQPVSALVAGASPDEVAKATAQLPGIDKVIVAKHEAYEHGLPEAYAPLLVAAVKAGGFSHVVAAHTAFGKNVLPRAAALLDVGQVSDIVAVQSEDSFTRPIYAGNAIAHVKSKDPIKLITVRSSAFPAAATTGGSAKTEDAPAAETNVPTHFVGEELTKSDRPDIGSAKIVIGGGRGMKSGENFKILYDLADKLGAAVGASRAAVDSGFVPNDLQIGQTGKIIAPQLYIAVGISGAIQHLAGMKDSKTIVAINKDADAPIFQVADLGLVGDLFTVVPEMTEKVAK
ncbi:Electron transfer flavoprotein alpha-subunit [Rhizophlyctis rosea]|nr:Electron transfer flavoprotein alpha-subunit [Rhizophlyctis rosea]